jgi:chromate reductase, NAD(P)H dehydrogenase (quinone)
MTSIVAETYADMLRKRNIDVQILGLDKLPEVSISDSIYKNGEHELENFGHSLFNSADKFIVVMPEYNGSFPGILKLIIDSCNTEVFKYKRFALVGVSSGRAGNLRGMDHLAEILNYLKAEVYSQKLPISSIRQLTNMDSKLVDLPTITAIDNHVTGYLHYLRL